MGQAIHMPAQSHGETLKMFEDAFLNEEFNTRAKVAAACYELDASVGKLVDSLVSEGLYNNTVRCVARRSVVHPRAARRSMRETTVTTRLWGRRVLILTRAASSRDDRCSSSYRTTARRSARQAAARTGRCAAQSSRRTRAACACPRSSTRRTSRSSGAARRARSPSSTPRVTVTTRGVAETTRARARHRRLALSMWQSVGKTRAQALLTCRAVAPLPPIFFRRDFLRRYGGLFHVTDLLPTALELAGASKTAIAKFELDGVSQMAAVLEGDATDAPRDSMLLHADKCVETARRRRTERGDRDPSRRHRGRPSRGQARGASRARPRDRLLFATREPPTTTTSPSPTGTRARRVPSSHHRYPPPAATA